MECETCLHRMNEEEERRKKNNNIVVSKNKHSSMIHENEQHQQSTMNQQPINYEPANKNQPPPTTTTHHHHLHVTLPCFLPSTIIRCTSTTVCVSTLMPPTIPSRIPFRIHFRLFNPLKNEFFSILATIVPHPLNPPATIRFIVADRGLRLTNTNPNGSSPVGNTMDTVVRCCVS